MSVLTIIDEAIRDYRRSAEPWGIVISIPLFMAAKEELEAQNRHFDILERNGKKWWAYRHFPLAIMSFPSNPFLLELVASKGFVSPSAQGSEFLPGQECLCDCCNHS